MLFSFVDWKVDHSCCNGLLGFYLNCTLEKNVCTLGIGTQLQTSQLIYKAAQQLQQKQEALCQQIFFPI